MPANLCIGKAVMIFTNFVFLLAGLTLVGAGIALLMDTQRLLLSRLILPAATGVGGIYISGTSGTGSNPGSPSPLPPTVISLPQQPVFYYAALIAMALGTVVCAVAVLGCWAARLRRCGILTAYLFVLSLMLLGELSVIILSALAPQLLGLVFDPGRLLAVLQRGYGAPGSEHLTAAVDLAQTTMECCGVRGPSDYNASRWRLRELGRRELRVPLSCCSLANADQPLAFLDPRPSNQTVCQQSGEDPSSERHQEGCGGRIAEWLSQQVAILGAAGGGLLTLQLIALFVAIFVCVQLAAHRSKPFSDSSSASGGHCNAGMTEISVSAGDTAAEDDLDVTDERHLPLHETQLGIDPPLYGSSTTKELPLSASTLVIKQEGPPVPAAPAGYGVGRAAASNTAPRRPQPPRPPPKPTVIPAACGCDMLYYPQSNQVIDPSLYQYVEELRAAEELRRSPYQKALVAAATRRSTQGRQRRQNRVDPQPIYQHQPIQQQQHHLYQQQQQPACYVSSAQHHTLHPNWQLPPQYEARISRPNRNYQHQQDYQAPPYHQQQKQQQSRQYQSGHEDHQQKSQQQAPTHVKQPAWQQKQQQILQQKQLQQQELQREQAQEQELQRQQLQRQHLQQQQLQQQQLQQQQLQQQQLQQQQLQQQQLQQQQLQQQAQHQTQQVQQQLQQQEKQPTKQSFYYNKDEALVESQQETEELSQELISQDFPSLKHGTLIGNGKIVRHDPTAVSKPQRPA